MRNTLSGLALVVAASLSLGAASKTPAPKRDPALERRINLDVADRPLLDFLDLLSQMTRVNFVVQAGLEKVTVTLSLEDAPLSKALDALGTQGLAYTRLKENTYMVARREDGAPVVGMAPAGCAQSLPAARINADTENMPLARFFQLLTEQSGARFVIDPGLETRVVTGRIHDEALSEIVDSLAGIKGFSCRRDPDGRFRISPLRR